MKTPKRSGSVLHLLGNGLLLSAASLGLLHTFLSLYPVIWDIDSTSSALEAIPAQQAAASIRTLTLLTLVFALLSLVVWSLPRFRWAAATLSLVGLAGAVLRFRLYLSDGAKWIVQAIVNMFADRVGWDSPVSCTFELPTEEYLPAIHLVLTLSMALLTFLLGWCIICARRGWLLLLLTLPCLLPGLLANCYPNWAYFTVLAACWCTMILSSLCRNAAPAARGRLTLITLPLSALLLWIIFSAVPQSTYTYPAWAGDAYDQLAGMAEFLFPTEDPIFDVSAPGRAPVSSTLGVDLSKAGPRNYTERTVLQISTKYSGPLYLRGTSYAGYTGVCWEPLDSTVYEEYLSAAGAEAPSPLLFLAQSRNAGQPYSITIRSVGSPTTRVYLPYALPNQNFSRLGLLADGDSSLRTRFPRSRNTAVFLPGALDLTNAVPGSDETIRTSMEIYEELVLDHYTRSDLSESLRTVLAELLGFYPPPEDQVNSRLAAARYVAEVLGQVCRYDLNTPQPPAGEDFVEYFLIDSRQGYCMHFATAATLMLREVGVPARYVDGYVAEAKAGRITNVPDSAAHAWVEIYLPGLGWYPVEVTPGYETAIASFAPDPTQSPTPTPAPTPTLTPKPTPPATSTPSVTPHPPPSGAWLPILGNPLSCACLALAVSAAFWLGQHLPKQQRLKRLHASDTNRSVLDGYRYLVRLSRWGGLVEPEVSKLAQKARFSQHTLTGEERRIVLIHFHRERLRIAQSLSPVKKLLFRYLWGVPRE